MPNADAQSKRSLYIERERVYIHPKISLIYKFVTYFVQFIFVEFYNFYILKIYIYILYPTQTKHTSKKKH